jgi:predicted nucleotide-binding protein
MYMDSSSERKQKLIEEIYALLEERHGSLVPILRKAIRLARLCGELEYQILFEIHLDGVSLDGGSRAQKWPQSVEPKWNYFIALAEDRASGDGNIQGGSIEQIETLLAGIKDARKDITGEDAAKAIKTELELRRLLTRIRNRVGNFLLQVESSSDNVQASTENISETISTSKQPVIFIGHGRSSMWKDLKDFIHERLGLTWDEFNREAVAGKSTKERLEQMLDASSFAFLVMTAEDEHADKTVHARENVVHEIGLFQGRLGFNKAIVLLEEGCAEFSNIHGLTQIHFPKGNIMAKSEEIRRVLEREGITK